MSSVRNIAPPSAPQSFDITPSGDKPILLHGWQRAYAEFDVQRKMEDLPFKGVIDTNRIRQELFEVTDGQWVMVETHVTGNVAEQHRLESRYCRAWFFADKASVKAPPLIDTSYVHALFQSCGITYPKVVGRFTEKGVNHGD